MSYVELCLITFGNKCFFFASFDIIDIYINERCSGKSVSLKATCKRVVYFY